MADWIFVISLALVPLVLGLSFGKYRRSWSRRKCALVSAALLPGLICIPGILLIVVTIATPSKDCGVDACGMTIAVAMMGLFAAFVGFAIGFVLALGAAAIVRRGRDELTEADTFK